MSESQNPTPAYEERRAAFLADLAELTRKYRITIDGCGCCDSPYLSDIAASRDESILSYVYKVGSDGGNLAFRRPSE